MKFSKKMMSILFLLAALIIALLLGSYNFLVIDNNARLPFVLEGYDNAAIATPSAATDIASATAPASASGPSNEDVSKLLTQYIEATK
jgi:hypothetical protein